MYQIWALAKNTWKEAFRKKDFYVFFIFLLVFLVVLCFENFLNISGISRYIKDLGFSLTWIFSLIIAVTFSAKQIPAEIESHTIYPLLAKPITRLHLILGKFLGAVIASTITFSIFYILLAVVSGTKGEGIAPVLLVQSWFCAVLFFALICAISICFSVFLTLSANIAVSFILYLFVISFADRIRDLIFLDNGIVSFVCNIFYYLIPHFEFYDLRLRLVHAWEPLSLGVTAAIFLYTVLYVSFILLITYRGFARKRL